MKNALKIGGLWVLLLALFGISCKIGYPLLLSKESPEGSTTLQMDVFQNYTYQRLTVWVREGAVMADDGEGNQRVIAYTEYLCPMMTVCENYIALFAYPNCFFYLIAVNDFSVLKIDTPSPVSALKLSKDGCALALSHGESKVYLYTNKGKLKMTVETELLLWDANLSKDGGKVGIFMVSAKNKNGFIAEIFRAKNGDCLSSDSFIYEGLPVCSVQKGKMFVFEGDTAIGYLGNGKFHLFP